MAGLSPPFWNKRADVLVLRNCPDIPAQRRKPQSKTTSCEKMPTVAFQMFMQ